MLGDNVNKIRLLNNLSRRQLADKLNITEQMLASIENNKRGKIPDWLQNLPKALNCTYNDLFDLNICNINTESIYITKFDTIDSEKIEKIPFNKFLLKNINIENYDRLVYLKYRNENMIPTILFNDELIIDTEDKEVLDNQLYLIKENSKYLVKRLFRTSPFDENIIVSNDNKIINNYPDYPINTRQAKELIVGKLVLYIRSL